MELAEKRAIITDKKNETSALRNELNENKKAVECLNREIKRKSELVESIIAENNILRSERADKNKNKKLTQAKHTEAEIVCRARGQIRTIRIEREEYKEDKDKLEKKHEKEIRTREERLKKAKNKEKNEKPGRRGQQIKE